MAVSDRCCVPMFSRGRWAEAWRAGVVVLFVALVFPVVSPSAAQAKAAPPVVPQVSISDAGLVQATNGDPTLTFNVTLSQPTTQAVTVDYETTEDWQPYLEGVPGEALAVSSAQQTTGQFVALAEHVLTFPKKKTEENITVTTLPYLPNSAPQWFTVVLSNPTGATLEDAYGTGTLMPATPTTGFSVSAGTTSIREPTVGSETADLTVDFSGPAPKKFTLHRGHRLTGHG